MDKNGLIHRWTHAQCAACWNARNPDKATALERDPAFTVMYGAEMCCFCGKDTNAGIFVRCREATLVCQKVIERRM